MGEKVTRRRRGRVLVPLVGVGVLAWVVRRRLGERLDLGAGWEELPAPTWASDATAPAPAHATAAATPPSSGVFAAATAPLPGADVPQRPSPVRRPTPPAPVAFVAPVALVAEQPARAVPTATAVASVTAPALPDASFGAGSVRALDDGASPDPDYVVKGKTATKVFHAPGGAYYTRTRADVWFRSADDARAAGFTERGPRRHT